MARILVVDDSQLNRRLVSHLVQALGHEGLTASGGRECLDLLQAGDIDLILLDCQMPDMSGWETIAQIRAAGLGLPVVALTAEENARERCLCAGMTDYLPKPVDPEDLARVLARCLEDPLKRARELATRSGDLRIMTKLAGNFLKETRFQVERMEVGLAVGDVDAVLQVLHRVKGSAGTFGAARFGACAGRMEARVRELGLAGAQADLEEFRALWVELQERLSKV